MGTLVRNGFRFSVLSLLTVHIKDIAWEILLMTLNKFSNKAFVLIAGFVTWVFSYKMIFHGKTKNTTYSSQQKHSQTS